MPDDMILEHEQVTGVAVQRCGRRPVELGVAHGANGHRRRGAVPAKQVERRLLADRRKLPGVVRVHGDMPRT